MSDTRPANSTAPAPTDQDQRADRVLAHGDPTSWRYGNRGSGRNQEAELRRLREPHGGVEGFVEAYKP